MELKERRRCLKVGLMAALAAGQTFSSRLGSELQVRTKTSLSDVVTEVDGLCEQLIREMIQAEFPRDTILGEESVGPGREASTTAIDAVWDADSLWIVDPLDGTTNFVSSIPLSVVSIACARAGKVTFGCVYDPYREEVFFALEGEGAFLAKRVAVERWLQIESASELETLPGQAMHVSDVEVFQHAVVATGMPVRIAPQRRLTEAATEIACQVKSFRALGAAALHLAYVAAGRLDAFWEFDLNSWDLAAGVFLIQMAGGIVQDSEGNSFSLRSRHVVAAGHEMLASNIRSVLQTFMTAENSANEHR
ncbi:MAG: inositol monophosphatase family protein [Alicyclobacillaceae bacterium]|nr:inositol monophosphatase family protein [Alicyclobacillaceae bacterium]